MSSSYQQRNLGTEDFYKASKESEIARKSYIKDFTGVAKHQTASMKAAATLQKYVDDAELSDFKETRKALLDFTSQVAVPFVKQQWQNEINEGIEDYTTKDIDRQQRWNKKRAEVEEAAGESEEKYRELWQIAKTKLLEEDRNRLLNMSHFEQMGWARARVSEKLNSYKFDRDTYLATSEDTLYTADGTEFTAKNYESVVGGYEIATRSFMEDWYGENARGGGFTKNYSQTKILPSILEQETEAKSAYYEQKRREGNQNRLESNENLLYRGLYDGETDGTKIEQTLATSWEAMPTLYTANGSRTSGFANWRKDGVLGTIKAIAAEKPYYDTDELKKALKSWKIPGTDGQTLYRRYGDEFSDNKIDQIFDNAIHTQVRGSDEAEVKKQKLFLSDMKEKRQTWVDENRLPTQKEIDAYKNTAEFLNFNPAQLADLNSDMNKPLLTRDKQFNLLEDLAEKQGNEITKDQVMSMEGVSTEVKEDFLRSSDLVTENLFLAGTETRNQFWKSSEDLKIFVNGKGTLIGGLSSKNVKVDEATRIARRMLIEDGVTYINKGGELVEVEGLLSGARKHFDLHQGKFTKEQSIQHQKALLEESFKKLQTENATANQNNPLYIGTGTGFKNIRPADHSDIGKANIQMRELNDKIGDIVVNKGTTGLRESNWNDVLEPSDFNLKLRHIDKGEIPRPGRVFDFMVIADGSGTWNSYDYYNHFGNKRAAVDEEFAKTWTPVPVPPEARQLHKSVISPKAFWKLYCNQGSNVCKDGFLSAAGVTSNLRVMNTVNSSMFVHRQNFSLQPSVNILDDSNTLPYLSLNQSSLVPSATVYPLNTTDIKNNVNRNNLLKQFTLTTDLDQDKKDLDNLPKVGNFRH